MKISIKLNDDFKNAILHNNKNVSFKDKDDNNTLKIFLYKQIKFTTLYKVILYPPPHTHTPSQFKILID